MVSGPPARYNHAMATVTGKVVLFGGYNGAALNDTWEWNGSAWTQRAVTTAPGARDLHAMSALDGKVVLFGGSTGSSPLGDTWEWDGSSWTQRTVPGPSSRVAHAMATLNGHVVLFGGSSTTDLGDTWEWDGNTWTQRMVPGPKARGGHAMTTVGARVLLFGGSVAGTGAVNDLWAWDGNGWTCLAECSGPDAGSATPAPRAAPAMSALGAVALVFGGIGTSDFGDSWTWNGSAWALLSGQGPPARDSHAMATMP
jgi:hypothetical protein